ncbi:hypothetical protein GCM10023193_78120 [Planotetraspora kaengkrachanensis]|uniref:Uncharacterized protein n=1 Tax=Planotetraspora kaengkrachanensis TaxID=575193 RepID=A0A8J3Q0R8_9ACTN|nr:hypothetical protein Pka01_77270 [Planotetraspora kaengkrachanensis]
MRRTLLGLPGILTTISLATPPAHADTTKSTTKSTTKITLTAASDLTGAWPSKPAEQ